MSSMFICPKCNEENDMKEATCWRCVRPFTKQEKEQFLTQGEQFYKDKVKLAKKTKDWGGISDKHIEQAANDIILTTSFVVAQKEIKYEIDVISAEVVYGINIFKDLLASVRDVFGGRSNTTQNVLKDARKTVMAELRKEALLLGADAVIAIDLDYQEISGGGKNGMLMVVASGTAVTLCAKNN